MADRIPVKNAIGVPGWLFLEGRTLRTDFPGMPTTNEEFDLSGIDLGRVAGMLLDQQDAEESERRRSGAQTGHGNN